MRDGLQSHTFMLETMGLNTGIDIGRLIEVRRKVESFMPGITFHGELSKAGIPKNYVPGLVTAA